MALFLVSFSSLVLLLFFKLLITRSRLSITQVISSFKWLNMHTSTLTTPTLITEVLRRVCILQIVRGRKFSQLHNYTVNRWKAFAVGWKSCMAKAYCTVYFTGKVLQLPIDPRKLRKLFHLK